MQCRPGKAFDHMSNFDDPNQSAHLCMSAQNEDTQVMERAPRQIIAATFKRT